MLRSPWEVLVDLRTPRAADVLRRRRYGVVEVEAGRLAAVRFRPWPKLVTWPGTAWLAPRRRRRRCGDRCRLYFNQPRRFPWALSLVYVESARDCTFATFRGAVRLLDEIARRKGIDALLCDAANLKISDRLLARWGWQPHAPSRLHRNFIKRFYGDYPPPLDEHSPLLSARSADHPPVLLPGLPGTPSPERVGFDLGGFRRFPV